MSNRTMMPVEFHGDTIFAFEEAGEVMVALKPICSALGLAWPPQWERIKRDSILREGVIVTVIPSAGGGAQETVCLPLSMLNGWLFGLRESRVKPALREKVIAYKRECFRALWAYFRQPMEAAARPASALVPAVPGEGEYEGMGPTERQRALSIALLRECRLIWGTRGAQRLWKQMGEFDVSGEAEATSEIDGFRHECLLATGDAADRVQGSVLYGAYCAWCSAEGIRPISQTRFGRLMAKVTEREDQGGRRWYLGLRLVEEA